MNDLDAIQILARIETELEGRSELPENYKFKGSVGKGRMADIPHLCIMDKDVTLTPQEEYYIVYLFSADLSGVYLSLNQGWTLYNQTFGAKRAEREIAAVTKLLREVLTIPDGFLEDPISLKIDDDDLGRGYELGNIFSKRYERGAIPSDEELVKDLRRLVRVYQELKESVEGSIIALGDQNEQDFQAKIQDLRSTRELPKGAIPRKDQSKSTDRFSWPRDPEWSSKALENAGNCCEYDTGHKTFDSMKKGRPFMEAHHLIPMSLQGKFKNSLDVPENIICLCPNCHRAIHHADLGYRRIMLRKFFYERKNKLFEREILVSLSRLFDFYSPRIEDELE